jgi:hypothetical protein
LVTLLPGYTAPTININAAYPSRRHLSAKVRSFIDFLVQRFAHDPGWHLPATMPAPKREARAAASRAMPRRRAQRQ